MGSESQRLKIYFHCKLKLSMMQGLKQWLSSAAIPRWPWDLLSFFVFVRSQAAASGGGTRSGVHQRCQCQSLPGHEGGRQIAGLGKQHFPDVSVCVGVSCPRSVCGSLSSCRSCSAAQCGIYQEKWALHSFCQLLEIGARGVGYFCPTQDLQNLTGMACLREKKITVIRKS